MAPPPITRAAVLDAVSRLNTAGTPATVDAVAAAVPCVPRLRVLHVLSAAWRCGMLDRHGARRRYHYTVTGRTKPDRALRRARELAPPAPAPTRTAAVLVRLTPAEADDLRDRARSQGLGAAGYLRLLAGLPA